MLWNDDVREHVFSNPYVYFSFFSNSGVTISIRAEFNEDNKKSKRKQETLNNQEVLYTDGEEINQKATEDQFTLFASKVLNKFSSTATIKSK